MTHLPRKVGTSLLKSERPVDFDWPGGYFPGNLFCVYDVPENELRQPDYKLAKPGIFLEQRHNVVVRAIVIDKIIALK
jgi:hypothetical protein